MGACASKAKSKQSVVKIENSTGLGKSKFKIVKAIGRGGFGKVFIVEKDGVQYAMKEMYKARVMNKNSVESVIKELEFLQQIDQSDPKSKFLVNV